MSSHSGIAALCFVISHSAIASGDVSFVQRSKDLLSDNEEECNSFPALSSWFLDEGTAILSPDYKKKATSANTPIFPDFDGDFKVEYFYSNHGQSHNPSPNEGMVFGSIKQSTFLKLNATLTRTDELPVMGRSAVDMHGSAIVDLDRDGYLDMFVTAGGENGNAKSLGDGNLLYWGSEAHENSVWNAKGGIYAAVNAGLIRDNGESRGRSTYIADFNNDGLLDILVHNLERHDKHLPSRIFYNNGNRTFTMDSNFEEYINNKIVVGTSLILQRDTCMSKDASYPASRIEFCSGRPYLSWVNYTFDKSLGHMAGKEIKGWFPGRYRNIQAAWIDDDEEPDFFMSSCHPTLAYSSGRRERITAPEGFDCETSTMQDFNLDGELEILSIYSQRGTSEFRAVLYTRDTHAQEPPFWLLKDSVLDWPKRWNGYTELIEDIGAVDYNNDGLVDVTFTEDALYHLTNTFLSRGQTSSNCSRPRFIAVVLKGIKPTVNQYGIGSTILLKADNMGPLRNETRSMRRAVSSYSHGTTKKGGAADPRTIFGLGMEGRPRSIEVTWPGGETSKIDDEKVLSDHIDDVTNPLIIIL